MNRHNPIANALRSQLNTQTFTGIKQEIQKYLERLKYE